MRTAFEKRHKTDKFQNCTHKTKLSRSIEMFAVSVALYLSSIIILFPQKSCSCDCPVYEDDQQSYRCSPAIDCYEDKLIRDFCYSDFCIEARIDSEKTSEGAKYKSIIYSNYTFRPIRMIRFSSKSMKALRMHLFFTPTETNRCGVEVKRRSIYYFCGHVIESNAVVTSCDFIKRVESLTLTERSFFLSGYKKTNCLQFVSDFRPIIDHNIRQEIPTDTTPEYPENTTRSEIERLRHLINKV